MLNRLQMVVSLGIFTSIAFLVGQQPSSSLPGIGPKPSLPPPNPAAETANFSTAGKWPAGSMPTPLAGFTVQRFADGLVNPRWLYVLPNGDVLVAESSTKPKPPKDEKEKRVQTLLRQAGNIAQSADRITLLRDADRDGVVDSRTVFKEGLNQPFGMLLIKDRFYVANTDGILQFAYKPGQTSVEGPGKKILSLPAGGYNNHWTRNLVTNSAGTKFYASIGSASNVAEHGMEVEVRRATILEINPDGSGERVYASGLRNPNGMDWQPGTNILWTVVNERDNLGDDLVPDYLTNVRDGGFYGWPYSYFGQNVDPRVKERRPDLVNKAIVPDFALGPHTASLGMTFYKGEAFPERYRGGVFVGQHGSWNRTQFSGYKVIFVPFRDGRPVAPVEDFLTGFLADAKTGRTNGRPVGVAVDGAGALLVADDTGNTVWRVRPAK
ncbi:MAG: PQQ-dependent sugar dehydrogenase [Bryobacteraceae bacterium]